MNYLFTVQKKRLHKLFLFSAISQKKLNLFLKVPIEALVALAVDSGRAEMATAIFWVGANWSTLYKVRDRSKSEGGTL